MWLVSALSDEVFFGDDRATACTWCFLTLPSRPWLSGTVVIARLPLTLLLSWICGRPRDGRLPKCRTFAQLHFTRCDRRRNGKIGPEIERIYYLATDATRSWRAKFTRAASASGTTSAGAATAAGATSTRGQRATRSDVMTRRAK